MESNRELGQRPIWVTGASGFIGGHLCRRLVDAGHRVLAGYHSNPNGLPTGAIPLATDLTDPAAVDEVIAREQPEVIFHLASCVLGSRDLDWVRPTLEANLNSTVYLMSAAARHQCRRFILTGSLEEPEQVQDAPSSPYAAAKSAASAYARMFHALYQFPAVIARVFMVYGPDQKDQKKLVPYVINQLLDGQSPQMSSGVREVDWIYVEDLVDGLLALADAPDLEGKTVDLGTGLLTSVRTVVEQIAAQIPDAPTLHFDPASDRPLEQVRKADITQTTSLTGWRPAHSLAAGLRKTIAWHAAQRGIASPAGPA